MSNCPIIDMPNGSVRRDTLLVERARFPEVGFGSNNEATYVSVRRRQMVVKGKDPQWRNEFLAGLQEMAADIIAQFDLQVVLQKAVDRTADLIGADIVTIHIYDPLTSRVRAAAGHGLRDKETFQQHKPDRGKVALLVVNKGEPVIAEDVSASELAGPFSTREGVQSSAALPLKVRDEVIGVLFVSYREPHKFKPEEVEALVSFGNFAGVAIQNAHLLQQERTLRQQAETLREVSTAISSALDLREVAGRILDELGRVIEYRRASLQLIRGNARTFLAGRGFDEESVDQWLLRPISQDRLISRIVKGKKPLILSDPSGDADWEIRPETADIRSWVGLPLVYREETIGLLTLDHDQPGFYTQAFEGLLVSFAAQAAIAIENARLFGHAEHRIRDLEIVNKVVEIIGTKLGTDDLLKTIVSQIADKLECTHCTIFLSQEEDGELLLVPRVTNGERSEQIMRRRFKPGEGLAGLVFKEGKSLVFDDARKSPGFAPATDPQERPRSMLVAPVKVGDQKIGVISADQDEYGWFSESDRRLVDALARHAGIAIERATGLELLQDIGNRIISAPNVDDVLQEIVSGAIRLTHTTSGTIYLFSKDGESVINSFLYPPGFDHPPPRMGRKGGITRQVIATGEMQIFPDIKQDDRINPSLYDLGIRSMIAVPLKLEERVIGVLYLNDSDLHDFTGTEVSLLSTLANQAAIAIQNAGLFEEVRTRADEVSLLQRVSTKISTTLRLDEILPSLVEGAMRLTKTESGVVHVLDSSGEKIVGSYAYPEEFRHPAPRISERGYTRLIIEKGEQIVVPDTHTDKRVNPEIVGKGVRSFAGTPLKLAGERVVGVLYLNDTEVRHFTEGELALLRTLADQAAIAIENARLFEKTRKQINELSALHDVGREIISELHLDSTLRSIAEKVCELTGSERSLVLLVDEDTGSVTAEGHGYPEEHLKDFTLQEVRDGVSGWVLENKEPALIPDVQKDPRCIGLAEKSAEQFKSKSLVIAPLLIRDRGDPLRERVIGTLTAVNTKEAPLFTQDDLDVVVRLADLATIAVENARLFEQLRKEREERIEAIREIGFGITAGLDPEEVLDNLLQRTLRLMREASVGEIWLLDEGTGKLTIRATQGSVTAKVSELSMGEGIVGWVAETEEPYLVGNVKADPRFVRRLSGTQSELAVPIFKGTQLIGVLNVEHPQPNAFVREDVPLLEAIASQVVIAIDNARLYDRLNALVEFGQTVTSGLRLREDEILDLIHHHASTLMDTDNMYTALYDEVTDTVRFGLAFVNGKRIDVATEEGWQPRRAGEGKTEEIIRTKRPLFHATKAEAEAWYAQPGHEEYVGAALPSWLGVPMIVGEKVLGVIATYHPKRDYVYSGDDLAVLQAMADQAAIALDSARLSEERRLLTEELNLELERKRGDILASREIDWAIVDSIRPGPELQNVLELILDKALERTGASSGNIMWYDEATGDLVMRTGRGILEGRERARQKVGEGIVGLVARDRQTYRVRDVSEERWKEIYIPFIADVRSELATPLVDGETLLGVLNVEDPRVDAFDEEDVRWLEDLAVRAVIAIRGAQAYEDLQQEQERRVEAERLGYLGNMAAVLAHRIGNKGGMVRRCVKDLYPLVDQKNKAIMDNLQTLERNNEFLLTMSEELLKPSKAASEALESLDINMLLEEALDHADIPSEIDVSTKLAAELPVVLANRWLVDVFLELISNAAKAMIDSPMKYLEIGSRSGKEFPVEVWCTDTGCGIAEEKRDAIFEMFHTDAEEEGHHGFGLWWIKTFITEIGGEIGFESKVDKGTTFVVKLGAVKK